MAVAARKRATIEDLVALGDSSAAEVLAGEIVPKAAPSAEHAAAQGALGIQLGGAFHRRGGGDAPGGWRLLPECDYLVSMVATRGEVVRAEPFEAIALHVGLLFGDDPDDVDGREKR
jgi:hypothetical protein